MKLFQRQIAKNTMRKSSVKGLGFPLYVNGKLIPEPVTISHVPGRAEAQGILGGMGIDPSMGSMGAYAAYSPTRGMQGFGDDAPGVAPINAESQPAMPGAALAPAPPLPSAPSHPALMAIAGFIDLASVAGLAYHGYKRNNSIGWSLVWAIFGGAVPIIGWPVALAQGFGEPRKLTPNRRRARSRRARTSKRHRRNGSPWRTPLITLAARAAARRNADVVTAFNADFVAKLGDLGLSSDEVWERYQRAYDAERRRRRHGLR